MKIYKIDLAKLDVNRSILILFIILFIFSFQLSSLAYQSDSVYYESYKEKINLRLYSSRKYTSWVIKNSEIDNIRYRFEPNSTTNLGVGITYQGLTLNLAYGFGFMNSLKANVPTRYLDLQAHIYPKNFIIDVFGQFYKGYYLRDLELSSSPLSLSYPEMQIKKLGLNFQYLFNGDKLSLRAAFLQNERQIKSAGGWLLGSEIYGGGIQNVNFLLDNTSLLSQRFVQIGPNIGYAYTLVFLKNFFFTSVISSHAGLGYTSLNLDKGKQGQWYFQPSIFARSFVGYNQSKWSINFNYVHNRLFLGEVNGFSNEIMTGNYRMNIIYRLSDGSGFQNFLDQFLNKIYLTR